MVILCTFWHYVYSKSFSFLRISKNPSKRFLVKVSSVSQYNFHKLITTFVCIDFSASKQVPFISTSSQRQRKAVKRICSASLDKQWLEEFVLQITVLNDREFSMTTKIKFHSRTGSTWFTPGIEVWSADRKFWFFLSHMDTKENSFWFKIGF